MNESTTTITTWTAEELKSFETFNPFMAVRLEGGILRALAEKLKCDLADSDTASVELPWGTFTAQTVKVGEAGNINVSFNPSATFIEALNSDSDDADFDTNMTPDFRDLYHDYLAYGFFYPDKEENKGRISKVTKCLDLPDEELEYFLNSYANLLVMLAKEHKMNGKFFELAINADIDHGVYKFEYADDATTVRFVAGKGFKQALKNDERAASSAA